MNNRDLLDILGEIDEELIEDAAPVASAERVARPKKFNFGWIKPVAVAASCVIILSGAMMAQPLFDRFNSPNIVDTDKEDEGQDGDFVPVETEGEAWPEDEDDKGYRSITIVGEKYNGYSLTYRICDAFAVGKKIDTIEVNHFWSNAPSDVTVLTADIFEVVGIDGELSYCYKYVDTYGLFDGWFIEESNYYFLNKHIYSFESIENMYEKLNMHEYANISDSVRFSQSGKSYDTYCHNFMLYGEAEEQFIKMLLSVKGVGLGSDEGLRNTLQFSANKKIEFSIEISNSDKHHFYVLDNGYILCIAYGSSAFDIGEDAANALIEFIVKNAEPQGYVWNETLGKWEKNGSDDKNEPDVGGGSDVYEDDDIPDNNAGSSVGSDVNIDVVPTSKFHKIVLHGNDRHIDRVLDSLRVDQAAFMEEIMKDYKGKYGNSFGASFETAKLMSDEILNLPFIVPKDGVEVSDITLEYFHEYSNFTVKYTIGNLLYRFEYDLLPGAFNDFVMLTRQGEASFNGVSFDVYGNDTYRVGNILCPGQEDRYIRIGITSDTKINDMPSLDMFEIIYLEPSSYEDIAELYEEEPIYDESEETETMVFEG